MAENKKRKKSTGKKKPTEATAASSWKKSAGQTLLQMPSGNWATVRNATPETFITKGLVPNALLPIIQKAIKDGEEPDLANILPDEAPKDMLDEMVKLMDAVASYCFVKPRVLPIPQPSCGLCKTRFDKEVVEDGHKDFLDDQGADDHQFAGVEGERDPEELYVDEVNTEDKIFLYQWAMGGVRDLARFRKEFARGVESLRSGDDVAVSTE